MPLAESTPEIDLRLRQLLAHLPLAPLNVLAPFVGRPESTLQRHVKNLIDGELVGSMANPLPSRGRPSRLLYLSCLGLAAARSAGVEPSRLARRLVSGGQSEGIVPPSQQLPGLLAAYELVRLLAAGGPGLAHLAVWEWPWRRVVMPLTGARRAPRVVRMPAAAAIAWTGTDGVDGPVPKHYVLVPDTGGLAQGAVRASLGHLARYQAVSQVQLTLVIATTTPRRATGWTTLVESVCRQRGLPPLHAEIATWTELRGVAARAGSCLPRASRGAPRAPVTWSGAAVDTGAAPPNLLPRPGRKPQAPSSIRLGAMDRSVLDLVARHPFLPTALVDQVLGGRGPAWARTRRTALVASELVRIVPAEEAEPLTLARFGLLEATRSGLAVVAAQLGLPFMAAVHHHGLAGGGPEAPVGARAALSKHLPHTLGADRVFAAVAHAARTHHAGGALLEWRGPAACAHGRLRPDGYGLLRLGTQYYGFFLEFDRGSMHAGRLRAKFIAYHRFAASPAATGSYAGLPTILVVTTGPGSEQRLARAIAAADVGQGARLPALLTTTAWLETTPAGPLGPVWRTAVDPQRCAWPCGSGHRANAAGVRWADQGMRSDG
jgi:protein involved in plasmid replication-relaxation